jgi:hypothetical protein
MRVVSIRRSRLLLAAAIAGLVALASIAAPLAATASQRGALERSRANAYDLQQDERLGGHTLQRHVGKTDADLAERLRREPNIAEASSYTDAATAARIVARAIEQNRRRIAQWEARRGRRPNLVFDYTQPSGPPIGRSLFRGERVSRACQQARVVLRWLERERRWIVLTSYPETRR